MNYGLRASFDGLKRSVEKLLSALCEDLNFHVIINKFAVDELSQEIKFDLTCCRESDLDLSESELGKILEELYLLIYLHGIDKSLITVS